MGVGGGVHTMRERMEVEEDRGWGKVVMGMVGRGVG